jgi:hypothetical protein
VSGYRRQGRSPHAALGAAVVLFVLVVLLDVGVTIWSAVWGAGLTDGPTVNSAMVAVTDLRELLNDMVKVMGGIVLGAFAVFSSQGYD